jgi:hypothetical protein
MLCTSDVLAIRSQVPYPHKWFLIRYSDREGPHVRHSGRWTRNTSALLRTPGSLLGSLMECHNNGFFLIWMGERYEWSHLGVVHRFLDAVANRLTSR